MDIHNTDNGATRRIEALRQRVQMMKDHDYYFYNQPVEEILEGAKVRVKFLSGLGQPPTHQRSRKKSR
jgi:hypothetical protein